MNFLDNLFNTYQKRVSALMVAVIVLIILSELDYFQLGQFLQKMRLVDDIYGLINYPVIYNTIIGEALVIYLEVVGNLFVAMLKLFTFTRCFMIIACIIIIFSYFSDIKLKRLKCFFGIIIGCLLTKYFLVLFYGFRLLNAQDMLSGIRNITSIGNIMTGFSLCIILCSLLFISYSVYLIYLKDKA